jgi:hypothetical protein
MGDSLINQRSRVLFLDPCFRRSTRVPHIRQVISAVFDLEVPEVLQRLIFDRLVQISLDVEFGVQGRAVVPYPDEDILHDVFRDLRVPDQPPAETDQGPAGIPEQFLEGRGVAASDSLDQVSAGLHSVHNSTAAVLYGSKRSVLSKISNPATDLS